MDHPPNLTARSLDQALDLQTPGELVAIVGGGGKSALLFGLANQLPGRTVLTTTTRIFANQTARAAAFCCVGTPEFETALRAPAHGLLVIGELVGDKAVGVDADLPARLLGVDGVDFVVVESDGSRMLPAKAPASHEPVIPTGTTRLVAVAGIDALAAPIREVCHRPERVAALVGAREQDCLSAQQLADLLCHRKGGAKGVGPEVRIALFINKIESASQWPRGREVARAALKNPHVGRVVLGAIEPSDPTTPPRFEVFLSESEQ